MPFLIRFSVVLLFVPLVIFATGCQPAAFPRTAEVAARGEVTAEVGLQAVAYEPQKVTLADGRQLGSTVAFFPVISGGVRVGVGGCEIGGLYALTRVLAETRCGILQERRGAPLSLAASGAFGIDYGPYFGAFARVGLDMSLRLGPFRPLVDVYLSTGRELRYLEDRADPPIEGPLPGSKSVTRQEMRLTIPFGVAIELKRRTDRELGVSLLLGATPYTVIKIGHCGDCGGVTSWKGDSGMGFTIGVELR